MKTKITHLSLPDMERTLANMRAGFLKLSLTDYIARLVRQDAEEAGLLKYLADYAGEEVARGK